MKEFLLSFVILGLVLTGFAILIKPRLVETRVEIRVVEGPTKVITKTVKAPLDSETRQALREYYLKHYGMKY